MKRVKSPLRHVNVPLDIHPEGKIVFTTPEADHPGHFGVELDDHVADFLTNADPKHFMLSSKQEPKASESKVTKVMDSRPNPFLNLSAPLRFSTAGSNQSTEEQTGEGDDESSQDDQGVGDSQETKRGKRNRR